VKGSSIYPQSFEAKDQQRNLTYYRERALTHHCANEHFAFPPSCHLGTRITQSYTRTYFTQAKLLNHHCFMPKSHNDATTGLASDAHDDGSNISGTTRQTQPRDQEAMDPNTGLRPKRTRSSSSTGQASVEAKTKEIWQLTDGIVTDFEQAITERSGMTGNASAHGVSLEEIAKSHMAALERSKAGDQSEGAPTEGYDQTNEQCGQE